MYHTSFGDSISFPAMEGLHQHLEGLNVATHLNSLPSEVLAHVFRHLEDADFFSARLSSRLLEKASFVLFGKRFFRKKGYMITTPSLDVLQDIADHEELRKYPQHVWFNPDCYTFATPECVPRNGEINIASTDGIETSKQKTHGNVTPANSIRQKQYSAYQECIRDHAMLLRENGLELKLTKAFRSLPNLQTIGMRRSEDYSPYGWTILRQAIGEDPRILGPISGMPTHALSDSTQLFIALIHTIADSHIKIQRLYTDAIEVDSIKPSVLPTEILNAACSSILYLELNAVKAWILRRISARPRNFLTDPQPGPGLVRLLSATPNLKELGLQIFRDRKQSHLVAPTPHDPWSWRESYPFRALSRIARGTTFAFLTRIKLEKVTATSQILQSLLEPCATKLTSVKMRDIRLLSDRRFEPRPWGTMFSWLADSCPELEYILFYHILHDNGGVSFTPEPPLADPDEVEEISFLIDHVPPSHGGQAMFSKYEHLNLEVRGREEVARRLKEVVEKHYYEKPLFSYAMDESLWHTDTSDEEW